MNSQSGTGDAIVDRLRQRQVEAWQRGERVLVEDLLAESSAMPVDDEALLELICAELLLREEAGEVPAAAEYIARFPRLTEALQRQFEVHQLLGSLDGLRSMSMLLSCEPAPEDAENRVEDSSKSPRDTSFPEVDGYQILRELGRGGMGVVYQARHLQLNRIVALKMIRDSALAGIAVRERFRVEAKAVARLQHPNIVQIYDYSDLRGVPFFSLEYVAGGSLSEFTRHQPQPVAASVALLEKLARAVDHAHREGIVHRDLKPANILLARLRPDGSSAGSTSSSASTSSSSATSTTSSSGTKSSTSSTDLPLEETDLAKLEPKISDFGLAKSLLDNQDLTHSAAMLGTCLYMSPEQAWGRSRDVGPATDVHALGLILYELLTGVAPFQSASMAQTLDQVRFTEPPPPSRLRPGIPSALDAICQRCLRKEPAERYQTAAELADDLRRHLEGRPVAMPRPASRRQIGRRSATIAVASVALAGLLSWMLQTRTPVEKPGGSQQPKSTVATVPPAIPPRTAGEPFAFLVGVRSYRLPGQSIDLEFTESDVDELSRVLFRHGYPRKNIRLLTQWNESDNPDLAPTGQNIRKQLQQLLETCIPDDTVLVAVTGMGGDLGHPAMYCYLPADGQPDKTKSLLTLADFYELFRHCPAKQKLLLVDTCQTLEADGIDWPRLPNPPPGMAVFFACAPNEASYEHASLRHGVFSYHVLRGLEGAADSNGDGVIVLDELVGYATKHVRQFVAEKFVDASQSPYLIGNLPGSTPLIRLNATSK